jgi:hypothetical protein
MPASEQKPAPAEGKIGAVELSALTGLSDRRHRQLAKDGYFPDPVESEYDRTATIRGLFKYYREHNQRTKEKIIGTKDRKTQLEMRILRARFERENGLVVPRYAVDRMLARAGSLIRGRLYSALEREFPGRVVGRSPAEIAAVGRALADELMTFLQDCDKELPRKPNA